MATTSKPEEKTRIAKAIADAGVCSRREAERLIAEGRVMLNGAVLTTPAITVGQEEVVLVDGKPLPARERSRLWLFHKPRGIVTTTHDPEDRPTVFSILPKAMPRVISVGRLDINTEGLLLLTNDGGLARTLELPATGWLRRYRVRVFGTPDRARLDRLAEGITVDGVRYGQIESHIDRVQGGNAWLTLSFAEGKNREVRRVLEAIDLKVNRLIRFEYGPFKLGELLRGEIQEVSSTALREALGADLASGLRRGDKPVDGLINAMAQPNLPAKRPAREISPEPEPKPSKRKGARPAGWAKPKPKSGPKKKARGANTGKSDARRRRPV